MKKREMVARVKEKSCLSLVDATAAAVQGGVKLALREGARDLVAIIAAGKGQWRIAFATKEAREAFVKKEKIKIGGVEGEIKDDGEWTTLHVEPDCYEV